MIDNFDLIETILVLFAFFVFPVALVLGYCSGVQKKKKIDGDFAFSLWAMITKNDNRLRSLEEDRKIQEVCDNISRVLNEKQKRIIKESDIFTFRQSEDFLNELK